MRWEKVQLTARSRETLEGKKSPGRLGGILGPGKRWGHTCNAVRGGRFLYIFGGYGKENCQTNDVYVYDTMRQAWSKPVMKGNPPSPRDSHSCTTVGNNLYVFGGTDGKSPLKDLHILDTSTNTWIVPSISGEGPEAREGHSATLVDKQLYIFGGCGKSVDEPEEVYFNDLYILDTERFIWKRAFTSGTPPSARDSHTCSSWKKKIIILGGEDASDYYMSDVHILDVDTLVWRELSTSGQILTPRAGHTTVALGKYLFVFGGFTDDRSLYDDLYVLNVEAGVWNKVTNACQGPSARFSVAGDCVDPQKGTIVFIGGCNETLEALDDMYYLYTDISMENGQDEPKQEKFSLRKELKRKRQEQYLIPVNKSENDSSQLMPLPTYGQAGKQNSSSHDLKSPSAKTFEAKVTNVFNFGYTIETSIDGKPLHGILFSCKPSLCHVGHSIFSRNMGAEGNQMKNVCDPVSKISGDTKIQLRSDQGQVDDLQGKESTSQDSLVETNGSDSNNSVPFDSFHMQAQAQEDTQTSKMTHMESRYDLPDDLHKSDAYVGPNHLQKPNPDVYAGNSSVPMIGMDSSSSKQQDNPVLNVEKNHSSKDGLPTNVQPV